MSNPQRDEDIYQAYEDFQSTCGPNGEDRYPHYWAYVQDSAENYSHLLRSIDMSLEGAQEELEAITMWKAKLDAEVQRHQEVASQQEPDGEEKGQYVNVRLWVAQSIQDPVGYVRERVLRDTEVTYPDISILETWLEDPE